MPYKTHKSINAIVIKELNISEEDIQSSYYITSEISKKQSQKTIINLKQAILVKNEVIIADMTNNKFEITIYNLHSHNINPLKINYDYEYDINFGIINIGEIKDINFLEKNDIFLDLTTQYKPKNKHLTIGSKNWDNYIQFIKLVYKYKKS